MRRLSGGLFAAVAVLLGLFVAVPTAVRPSAPPVTVLVHGAAGSADAAIGALDALGLPVVHPMRGIGVVVAAGPAEMLRRLNADTRVERVEPAPPPMEFQLDTSRRSIRLDDAATITTPGAQGFAVPYDGTGVSIAIIDQGIDASHPMFQLPDGTSQVVRNLELACLDRYPVAGNFQACHEALEGDQYYVDAREPANDTDGPMGGHGTHVASTAAGQRVTTADGRTLQGVAPGAKLIGLGATSDISVTWAGIAGLNWVIENHKEPCGKGVPVVVCPPIRVVNNSWGYPDDYDEQSALNKAKAAVIHSGVALAWSAGNNGETPDKAETNAVSHGGPEGLVSVASYNDSDRGGRDGYLSGFSSRGLRGEPNTYPDISAPGDGISAACRPYFAICGSGADTRDPNYNTISGTSMASPHVAGAMALLLQANPALQPAELERIIEATAYKFRSTGKYEPDPAHPGGTTSYDKGHGLLDVAAALAMVTGRPTPPVSTYPDAYRPPEPKGAASLTEEFDWSGGPIIGPSTACGTGPSGADCERTGVRLKVPDGGADVTVIIDPAGTPVGVELIGPDGSVATGNYYVDVVGKKTLEATVFADGVYTVTVWSLWGAAPTYSGNLSLVEVEDY